MSLDSLGGRKFLLTLLIILVGTAVQILSKNGVSEAFTALLIGATAAYGATNAIITNKALSVKQQSDSDDTSDASVPPVASQPAEPAIDPQAVADAQKAIQDLQAGIESHTHALTVLQDGLSKTQKIVSASLIPR